MLVTRQREFNQVTKVSTCAGAHYLSTLSSSGGTGSWLRARCPVPHGAILDSLQAAKPSALPRWALTKGACRGGSSGLVECQGKARGDVGGGRRYVFYKIRLAQYVQPRHGVLDPSL